MRKSQELQLELSEHRGKLAEVTEKLNGQAAEGTEPNAEHVAEADKLTRDIRACEVRYRSAVIAEDAEDKEAADKAGTETRSAEAEGDPETREIERLETRASVGAFMAAAVEGNAIDGAEAELRAALKIGGDGFPLRLLAPDRAEIEARAKTDTDTAINPRRWLDRLFADTAAMRLGLTFESVGGGVPSYPITTAGAASAQRGREQVIADAAWTVGVSELRPTRTGVRCTFTREDAARLPGLESALRRDLRAALTYGMDKSIFVGDADASEEGAKIVGLDALPGMTEIALKQGDKVKGPETLAAFAGLVDGVHAGSMAGLRIVATLGAWRLWETTPLPAPVTTAETMSSYMRRAGLAWSSRGDIEDATTAGKIGAFIGRDRGIAGAGVVPVWESADLIRDIYSGASKGEIALTLSGLWNIGFPRLANFARLKFVA